MAKNQLSEATQILVVDDEPDLRTLYELTLLREGYAVQAAGDLAQARALLEGQNFDLVITDMRLPDGSGVDLLRHLRAQQRSERCIVITAYGSAENAVESLKAGAFDYLTKPVDLRQFRSVVAAASQPGAGAVQAGAAKPLPQTDVHAGGVALERMVGQSACMQQVRDRIAKVARSMAPVLVHGESGTGKELVAKALHANSHRCNGPWVAVNCGAIPENLLEVEFFGAKKGAYTGATHDRTGFFQAAHKGTLFLDEIGDLPPSMQAKLLRAVQERRVRPVGATQEEPVDVRIVSATHKDLRAEVEAGRFRQDLFYRLNVIDISIPPLRERPQDLPALCATLLARIADEAGAAPQRVGAVGLARLARLPLRGNVRELENILHRAVALSDQPELALDETESPTSETVAAQLNPLPADLQSHLDAQERAILLRALQHTGFNRTSAAQLLGLSLRQMRYRIARLKIDMPADAHWGPSEDANESS
jgi:two-component system response regulator PilR (NtrC family)